MNLCHNCGKYGHQYKNCKKPIISYGVVQCRITPEKKIEYLMICRRNTLGYIDFIRGKYRYDDKSYIISMMKQMTNKEKYNILHYRFDALWNNLWYETDDVINDIYKIENNTIQPEHEIPAIKYKKNEFFFSKEKFYLLHQMQEIHELVKESNYFEKWSEAEWGFPKGRKNYNESNYECALRETNEETGYPISSMTLLNHNSFQELFRGSNNKTYKHIYYVMLIDYEDEKSCTLRKFDQGEVSKIQWKSYEQCLQDIRTYNVEKKQVLTNIHHYLCTL
jgi:ADP-ribose pyrophosphatase YjhB (NUDIX family)